MKPKGGRREETQRDDFGDHMKHEYCSWLLGSVLCGVFHLQGYFDSVSRVRDVSMAKTHNPKVPSVSLCQVISWPLVKCTSNEGSHLPHFLSLSLSLSHVQRDFCFFFFPFFSFLPSSLHPFPLPLLLLSFSLSLSLLLLLISLPSSSPSSSSSSQPPIAV